MPDYDYLIVGGGMTADAAVRGIREVDGAARIGLVSAEPHPPYDRPPLSKGLWKGGSEDKIWRKTESSGAELHRGRRVTSLDTKQQRVTDDQGAVYGYGKVLLATGGTPRRLPFGGDRIIYFRTFDDYRRLRELARDGARVAVIGGGFIGSEIAAALAMNECQVVMLFPEDGIGARVFPAELSRHLNAYYRERGVEVLANVTAADVSEQASRLLLATTGEATLQVDAIVAGIGIEPSVALARDAGLEVNNGIVVDEHLQTSVPGVYAAGDVASFPNRALGRRIRVEHEENANAQGRAAGRAMAGRPASYDLLPSFYSDLFELGYEAVGDLDARLETVEDWQDPFQKGVVYYLDGGRVRGVLLWQVWGRLDAARQLIAEPGPHSAKSLRGAIRE